MWVVEAWNERAWLWEHVSLVERFADAEALVRHFSHIERRGARTYREEPDSICEPDQAWRTATTAG